MGTRHMKSFLRGVLAGGLALLALSGVAAASASAAECPGTVEGGGVALCSGGHEQKGTFAFTGQKEPKSEEKVFFSYLNPYHPNIACNAVTLSKGSFVAASKGKLEVSGLYIEYTGCRDPSNESECEVRSAGGGETVLVDGAWEAGGPGLSAAPLTNTSELFLNANESRRWTKFSLASRAGKTCAQTSEYNIKGEAKCTLPNSTTELVTHILDCSDDKLLTENSQSTEWDLTAEVKLASGKAWSLKKV